MTNYVGLLGTKSFTDHLAEYMYYVLFDYVSALKTVSVSSCCGIIYRGTFKI